MAIVRSIAGSVVRPIAAAITGLADGAAPDPYAANGFSPAFVVDESATSAPFYRSGGSVATYDDIYTTDTTAGGLCTQNDSSGNLVWNPHNLVARSESADGTYWVKAGATVSANAATDPTGSTGADKLEEDATTGTHIFYSPALVGGPVTTVAVVASAAERTAIAIGANAGPAPWAAAAFNLSAGTAATAQTDGTVWTAVSSITPLGGGLYLCLLAITASTTTVPTQVKYGNLDTATPTFGGFADYSYTGTLGAGANFWGMHVYRSDIGGMADVPSDVRSASALTKYVPTTTAAKYLIRRRHYRYNGTSYVPTLLHEPVGATNVILGSRDIAGSDWSDTGTTTATANVVGIDGESNTATTITDSDAGSTAGRFQGFTVPDDSNRNLASVFVKKTSSASTFPGIQLTYVGGGPTGQATINTDAGTLTNTTFAMDSGVVEDWSPDYWRVTVGLDNDSTGHTTLRVFLLGAVNSDGSGTWSNATTGSAVFDQVDVVLNASIPSSPIPTTGASVTRSADTCKVKAAALPFSSTAMSMAITCRLDLAANSGPYPWSWELDTNNRWLVYFSGASNTVTAFLAATTNAQAAAGNYGAGAAVSGSIASRAVASSALQVALSGAAGAENTTSIPAIPALSSTDMFLFQRLSGVNKVNGQMDTLVGWAEDIAEAGIEEATA